MAKPLTILVASMGGTAELVAEEMLLTLRGSDDFVPRAIRMERVGVDLFRGGGLFIICTSTYGEGEVPENGKALLAALRESGLDLSRVRYGVFGLGDRHHAATFCWGAKHFDEALSAAGATRLGEIGRHDLREPRYPEEHGLEWLSTWLTAAGAPTPQGE